MFKKTDSTWAESSSKSRNILLETYTEKSIVSGVGGLCELANKGSIVYVVKDMISVEKLTCVNHV